MLIEAGNGGGGIITTPLPSGILPLIESRPNHPLRCGGAGDPEVVTTEMQGHSETGKGNDRKDEAGRQRSGKALESSANTQKCGYWMCLGRMEHFVSFLPPRPLPLKNV